MIVSCSNCGGLRATSNEFLAGTPCRCSAPTFACPNCAALREQIETIRANSRCTPTHHICQCAALSTDNDVLSGPQRVLAAKEAEVKALRERAEKAWDAGHIAGMNEAPGYHENKELRDLLETAEADRDRVAGALRCALTRLEAWEDKEENADLYAPLGEEKT